MARFRKSNIAHTGGKKTALAVQGLKELEQKLKQLNPEGENMSRWMQAVVANASKDVRDEMRSQAESAGWGSMRATSAITERPAGGKRRHTGKFKTIEGSAVLRAFFSFGKPKPGRRSSVSALAGVSKPEVMVEWRAGLHPHPLPGRQIKQSFPNIISESLPFMLEFGSSKMTARPAIRNAVKTVRPRVIATITDGFQKIFDRFAA